MLLGCVLLGAVLTLRRGGTGRFRFHLPGPIQRALSLYRRGQILNAMNQPVSFHGILHDQHGARLSNIVVKYFVTRTTGKPIEGQVRTDGSGYFNIDGVKGIELQIQPIAPGYTYQWKSTFKFALVPPPERYAGTRANPTMVRLWKPTGPERLIYYDSSWHQVEYEQREIHFDIVRARIVESGGDFKLSVDYETAMVGPHEVHGCRYNIEAIDGEVQPVSEETHWTTLHAPETGYTNVIAGRIAPSSGGESSYLFLISRNRKVFSKARIVVMPPGRGGRPWNFRVDALVNDNGSGNWEIDWTKVDRRKLSERAIIDATGIVGRDL